MSGSPRALRARGMVTRMGTLMVERRSADALAVAERVAALVEELGEQFDTPQLHRFTLNHATLLFRRGARGDSERARHLVLSVADSPSIQQAQGDPDRALRADNALARSLPSVQLALNRIGAHRRAAMLGQRLMAVHRSPHGRYHAAALNTSLCWHAEGLACWGAAARDGAEDAFNRGISLLEDEIAAGAPHIRETTPEMRQAVLLLRESNLLYGRLWRLVVRGGNAHILQREVEAANHLLDKSTRNPAVTPIAMMLRHGRLADVLVEQATCREATDPANAGVLAMTALVYYSPRWEIHRRDSDMTPTFVLRYAEASRLAGSPADARAMLIRGVAHLDARFGPDHRTVRLLRHRLRQLDEGMQLPRQPWLRERNTC